MSLPTTIMRPSLHDITPSGYQAKVMDSNRKVGDRRSHHELTYSSMLLLMSGTAISWLPS